MISETDFEIALDQVINDDDKIIILYSGLTSFIHRLKFKKTKPHEIPKIILDLIEKKIGKERTLFLPSFSGGFVSKNGSLNIEKDIDSNNGILPKNALKRNYLRTYQPIHSYLVYGKTSIIKNIEFKSSWGKKSLLEFFSKNDARICNLGLPWNKGCAYLHRFEEIYKVPWRYNKKIEADLFRNGKKIGKCNEVKYCSSIEIPLNYDFKPFIKNIEQSKSFLKSSIKNLKFESVKTSCLNKIGKKNFSKNPWIIVKNKSQTKNWIKYKKKKRIIKFIDIKNKFNQNKNEKKYRNRYHKPD